MKRSLAHFAAFAARLVRRSDGLALTEFAFIAPILLTLGFAGLELANFAIVSMQLNQAAVHIADNSSRIGERDNLSSQRIFENDINDLFIGVNIQAGDRLDLYEHGRVILSSLEQNSDGGQWIHWQRCMGKLNKQSAYGSEGTGETGTGFPGMGSGGSLIQAPEREAIMYVEIFYTYQPVVGNLFSSGFLDELDLSTEAVFNVRGTRDLSQIYTLPVPATPATCDKFEGV
jgi:hypothetical protein